MYQKNFYFKNHENLILAYFQQLQTRKLSKNGKILIFETILNYFRANFDKKFSEKAGSISYHINGSIEY